MYQAQRFLYDNILERADLFPADQQTGVVSGAVPTRLNAGETCSLATWGAYSGQFEERYTIEAIVASGTVTIRWRNSALPLGTWAAEGLPCPLVYTELDAGIFLKFSALPTVGGVWQFRALPSYSIQNVLLRDRQCGYRTPAGIKSTTITVACPAAERAQACILTDHNLTANATVRLLGNTANIWTDPAFEIELDPTHVIAYFDATIPYWQLVIADETNPADELYVGEWFLGPFLELTKIMDWGSDTTIRYNTVSSTSPAGLSHTSVLSEQRKFTAQYATRPNADIDAVAAMLATVFEAATQRKRPIFFHESIDDLTRVVLCLVQDETQFKYEYLDQTSFSLSLEGVPLLYV